MNRNEALYRDINPVNITLTRTIYVDTAIGVDETGSARGYLSTIPFKTIAYAISWINANTLANGLQIARDISNQWTIELLNEHVSQDLGPASNTLPDYCFLNRRFGPTTTIRNTVLSGPVTWLTMNTSTVTGTGSVTPVLVSFAGTSDSKGQRDTIFNLTGNLTWDCSGVTTGSYLYLNLAVTGVVTTSVGSGQLIVGRAYKIGATYYVEQYPYGYSNTIQITSEKLSVADNLTYNKDHVAYVQTNVSGAYDQDPLFGVGIKTPHIQNHAVTTAKIFVDDDLDAHTHDIKNIGSIVSLSGYLEDSEVIMRNIAFFGGI